MEKRNNKYHLEIEEVTLKDGSEGTKKLSLDFENHDDLFKIFGIVQSKNIFSNESTAHEFALGLKLFTEAMIKNKDHVLFEELKPAMTAFIQKLKSF